MMSCVPKGMQVKALKGMQVRVLMSNAEKGRQVRVLKVLRWRGEGQKKSDGELLC